MGCKTSKNDVEPSVDIDCADANGFTTRDKYYVTSTWTRLRNDMPTIGGQVFFRIFSMAPMVKTLFGFEGVAEEVLLSNERFRMHSSKFMQAVAAVVENIDELKTEIKPTLEELGNNHRGISGFDARYISVFVRAMSSIWGEKLGHRYTHRVSAAWDKVFQFIATNFVEGHHKSGVEKFMNNNDIA